MYLSQFKSKIIINILMIVMGIWISTIKDFCAKLIILEKSAPNRTLAMKKQSYGQRQSKIHSFSF